MTVVTRGRMTLFGDVIDGEMRLNDTGRMISQLWEWLENTLSVRAIGRGTSSCPTIFTGSSFLVISTRAVPRTAPTHGRNSRTVDSVPRKSLGRLVGAFKTVTTKQANLAKGTPGQVLWQRNFYERIIRNDQEWNRIREYISNNPVEMGRDSENPAGRV